MATNERELSDTSAVRLRFLEAVASAEPPVRARNLIVPGLDRRAVQKRLERLRRKIGGSAIGDEELIDHARDELTRARGPAFRGLAKLQELGDPRAREFAREAGLQGTVIGDWVEIAHSPADLGWSREQISVREMPKKTLFSRGRSQSWLTEKKQILRALWKEGRADDDLKASLTPNLLKMDLVGFGRFGTVDAPDCLIQVAPMDWLTCLALNSRVDEPAVTKRDDRTVREQWGKPALVVERQAMPGMLVAHIVVLTSDERFLVCLRQSLGLQDERDTWSVSIEERWSAERAPSEPDAHPFDVVNRALREELGMIAKESDIRVLAWGIESSVLYPGFIAIARVAAASWEIEGLRASAPDANEVTFVSSVPADLDALQLMDEAHYSPPTRSDMSRHWHRTSKARIFSALSHLMALRGEGRDRLLERVGNGS